MIHSLSSLPDPLRHPCNTMFLPTVEIRNYLSIEHAVLDGLDRLNILIGKNSAGKSAVFGALWFLGRVMHGQPPRTTTGCGRIGTAWVRASVPTGPPPTPRRGCGTVSAPVAGLGQPALPPSRTTASTG